MVITNDKANLRIKVIDEGPGIDPKEENQLFKKFTKLSAKPTAGETSTGLGLSLVKRYISLIGGNVWLEKHSGTGATFIVELPLSN